MLLCRCAFSLRQLFVHFLLEQRVMFHVKQLETEKEIHE